LRGILTTLWNKEGMQPHLTTNAMGIPLLGAEELRVPQPVWWSENGLKMTTPRTGETERLKGQSRNAKCRSYYVHIPKGRLLEPS